MGWQLRYVVFLLRGKSEEWQQVGQPVCRGLELPLALAVVLLLKQQTRLTDNLSASCDSLHTLLHPGQKDTRHLLNHVSAGHTILRLIELVNSLLLLSV